MDIKDYFTAKKEMTKYCSDRTINCNECPLSIFNNNKHVSCEVLEFDHPKEAEEIIQEYINKLKQGYVVCLKTNETQPIEVCNAHESCTECIESRS